jgi:hypothetical protein
VAVKFMAGRLSAGDVCVMLILLVAAACAWLMMRAPEGVRVVAERDGRVLFSAPLNVRREASLEGPLGPTVLLIEHGSVRIIASSCPQHFCQKQGAIARCGETLVCLPNRLVVRISGPSDADKTYDFLSH